MKLDKYINIYNVMLNYPVLITSVSQAKIVI